MSICSLPHSQRLTTTPHSTCQISVGFVLMLRTVSSVCCLTSNTWWPAKAGPVCPLEKNDVPHETITLIRFPVAMCQDMTSFWTQDSSFTNAITSFQTSARFLWIAIQSRSTWNVALYKIIVNNFCGFWDAIEASGRDSIFNKGLLGWIWLKGSATCQCSCFHNTTPNLQQIPSRKHGNANGQSNLNSEVERQNEDSWLEREFPWQNNHNEASCIAQMSFHRR